MTLFLCYLSLYLTAFSLTVSISYKLFRKLYLRYIYDIFLIWNGTLEELEVFLQKVNNYHPTIKFDYQISKMKIHFIDTTVFKVGNQRRTKFYKKPTDKQGYLHSKLENPRSMKSSIAYSKSLLLNKSCYNKKDPEKTA